MFIYIDDILVASNNAKAHKEHLCLFQRLDDHSLVINVHKCQIGCNVIDFLGHCITYVGIMPLPAMVDDVTHFSQP